MWIDYWFEVTMLMFFVSLYVRMWFVMRDIRNMNKKVHEIHAHVFMQAGDIQVGDGDNYQVMSLEQFKDHFGFDPTSEKTPATDKASSEEIEAWDNS